MVAAVRNFLFDVQDTKKLVAISLLPVVGIMWSLFRQIDLNARIAAAPNADAAFQALQQKNQVKKISACSALAQAITFAAYHAIFGSLATLLASGPFIPFTLAAAVVYYATAKLNEYQFPTAADLTVPGQGLAAFVSFTRKGTW